MALIATDGVTLESGGSIQEIPDGYGRCPISGTVWKLWQPYRLKLPWPTELAYRRGSPCRLRGIEVYFDFNWRKRFFHGRSAFPNGEYLADFVRGECPADRTPALVLTTRDDVTGHSFDWHRYFVVVVNINEYLSFSDANPATDFFASRFKGRLSRLVDIEESEISAWADGNSLSGIEVVTFDELFGRISSFVEILGSEKEKKPASTVAA